LENSDREFFIMALKQKFLWIVNMNTENSEAQFSKHALAMDATGVCIRTSATRFPDAIKRFHDLGLKVYAWRWPPATQAGSDREADLVVSLIRKGLDGYIVDPESDTAGATNDWNRTRCAPFAKSFCKTITDAAPNSFVFGTTSGCAYPAQNMKPNIPWAEFFGKSDALYPQCYWRWTGPSGRRGQKINGGSPQKAIDKAMPSWKAKGMGKPIVPMAGEVDVVTTDEIEAFGAALARLGVTEGHFYTDNGLIPVANLAAMKEL
jgi:hypothetical protein